MQIEQWVKSALWKAAHEVLLCAILKISLKTRVDPVGGGCCSISMLVLMFASDPNPIRSDPLRAVLYIFHSPSTALPTSLSLFSPFSVSPTLCFQISFSFSSPGEWVFIVILMLTTEIFLLRYLMTATHDSDFSSSSIPHLPCLLRRLHPFLFTLLVPSLPFLSPPSPFPFRSRAHTRTCT